MRVTPIMKLIVTAYFSPQLHGTGSTLPVYGLALPVEYRGSSGRATGPQPAGPRGFLPGRDDGPAANSDGTCCGDVAR